MFAPHGSLLTQMMSNFFSKNLRAGLLATEAVEFLTPYTLLQANKEMIFPTN